MEDKKDGLITHGFKCEGTFTVSNKAETVTKLDCIEPGTMRRGINRTNLHVREMSLERQVDALFVHVGLHLTFVALHVLSGQIGNSGLDRDPCQARGLACECHARMRHHHSRQ